MKIYPLFTLNFFLKQKKRKKKKCSCFLLPSSLSITPSSFFFFFFLSFVPKSFSLNLFFFVGSLSILFFFLFFFFFFLSAVNILLLFIYHCCLFFIMVAKISCWLGQLSVPEQYYYAYRIKYPIPIPNIQYQCHSIWHCESVFFFLSCWEREKRKRRKKRDYPPHLTSSQLTLTPSLSLSLVFSSFLLAKFITCLERSELDYFFHMRYWSLF
jgi:signal transduction histidine kinase